MADAWKCDFCDQLFDFDDVSLVRDITVAKIPLTVKFTVRKQKDNYDADVCESCSNEIIKTLCDSLPKEKIIA